MLIPSEKKLYEKLKISDFLKNKTVSYIHKRKIEMLYIADFSLKEFLFRRNFLNDNKAVSIYITDQIPIITGIQFVTNILLVL